jgi:hypothetical protein
MARHSRLISGVIMVLRALYWAAPLFFSEFTLPALVLGEQIEEKVMKIKKEGLAFGNGACRLKKIWLEEGNLLGVKLGMRGFQTHFLTAVAKSPLNDG